MYSMQEEAAAGEWAALLSVSEEQTEQEGITTDDLNQVRLPAATGSLCSFMPFKLLGKSCCRGLVFE